MISRAREIYRQTRKPIDNVWTAYLSRPPAALVVALIEKSPLTPNQVTLLSFLVGMGSAAMLALTRGHLWLILAALVFQFAYVLDCVDGMLARARQIASPQGHLLDFLMDELKALAFFAAASLRLYFESGEAHFLILGVLGQVALASGLSLTTFTRRPEIAGPAPAPGAAPAPRPLPLRVVEGIAKFLVHYPSYLLYVAAANRLDLYFYAYLGVNTLYYARTFLGVALKFGRPSTPAS